MATFTKKAVDIFAPQDVAGEPREVDNGEVQVWGTEVETAVEGGAVNLANFTSATSGNMRDALQAAKDTGATRILVPFDTFSISPDLDLTGITLVGRGTLTSGSALGAYLEGISRRDFKRFPVKSHPSMEFGAAASKVKLLQIVDDTELWVVTPTPIGYARIHMVSGVFTTSNSVGSPAESLRVTDVQRLDGCLVAWKTVFDSSGATLTVPGSTKMEDHFLKYGGSPSVGGTGQLDYYSVDPGGYVEFALPKTEKNYKGNVALLSTSSGSSEMTIAVNGKLVTTTGNTGVTNAEIELVEFWVGQTFSNGITNLVRVTNTGTGTARIICANLFNLRDVTEAAMPFDHWYAVSRGLPYRENNGAADYAIREVTSGLWRGSFHGGETLTNGRISVDDVNLALDHSSSSPVAGVYLSKRILVRQRIDITGNYDATVITDFSPNGGYDLLCGFIGSIRADRFWTCMATTHVDMNFMLYPYTEDVGLNEVYVGDTDKIVQYGSPSGGIPMRHSSVEFTVFDQGNNSYGGARIRPEPQYKKVYAGPVFDDDVVVGDIRFGAKHRFF